MYKSFTTLMTLGMAAAAPYRSIMSSRQDAPATSKLLIGTPGQILTADFDGTSFAITSTLSQPGKAPSWLLYSQDNSAAYANDENSPDLNLLKLDGSSAHPTVASTAQGTTGVVSLAFNADKTQLVGASYGTGSFDVWNVAEDGSLTLLKNVELTGPTGPKPAQTQHRAHQALLDPSGRYFVIPDLGGDALAVVDSQGNGSYSITSTVNVGSGSGPRHGGFVSVNGGRQASHYVVATELSSELVLFELTYGADSSLDFKQTQRLSTYGEAFPPATPATAAAGELVVSNGGHIYVSNRLSGNATDSISHFVLEADGSQNGTAQLRFADTVSSGGAVPRMFSLSTDADQSHVFVANQGGGLGLVALKRDPETGALGPDPVASLPVADLVAPEFKGQENVGPQFVQQI